MVAESVGPWLEIVVAMDWTDFDADIQAALGLHLVTRHGKATPLLWLTVDKDERRDRLLLLNAFAILLLTILAPPAKASAWTVNCEPSTAKRRVHSLFRQAACSMTSFQTCRRRACVRSSSDMQNLLRQTATLQHGELCFLRTSCARTRT